MLNFNKLNGELKSLFADPIDIFFQNIISNKLKILNYYNVYSSGYTTKYLQIGLI